ncbi:MAG: HAMP domain-containing methyl-accepting chemotaxis protein [Rhodospirillales bacterium]
MPATRTLTDFKVKTRLYFGFLALIVVVLLVAGAGLWGIDELGGQVTRLGALGGNVERVLTTKTLLETIRGAQMSYMLDHDATAVTDMQAAQARAAELLAASASNTTSGERLAIYHDVAGRLAAQVSGAAQLVELGRTADEARVHLFADGIDLTAATDKLMAAAHAAKDEAIEATADPVERSILLVRIEDLRFLTTIDAAGPGKFHVAVAKAALVLAALDKVAGAGLRPLVGAVQDTLIAYRREFDAASTAMLAQNALFHGTLTPMIAEMQAQLHKAEGGLLRDSTDATDQARRTVSNTTRLELAATVGGLVLGLLLAFFIARSILGPLIGMTAAMMRLASGDHAVEIPARENTDEIGDMARAVEVFKQNGIKSVRMTAEQNAARLEKEQRAARLDALTQSFEAKAAELVGQVSSAASALQATAQSMAGTASEATLQATNVAAAAEEASTNVQTVAAAAEELASSITEISRLVAQSADVSRKALDDARHTDAIVQALADGAQKIGEVLGLISNIAGQTNLLALNATIEAARAGDAGKGFAVVASEVKSLAAQTAKATEDIGRQITQIQTATKNAVESIRGIGKTISEISQIAASVAAAVEEQGSATQEIARNVQQAAAGTQDVSSNIVGVSRGARDTGDSAKQMLGAAEKLSRQADQLRSEVGAYVAGVQAA